jgi:DNA-directed RNA polymerase subunit alpha
MQDLSLVKIQALEGKKDFGRFVASPLESGFGHTLGSSLRRVLLESLPGAAITAVKIAGVPHQFSTIKGVREDVVEIILNIKKIRLRLSGQEKATLLLKAKGSGEVKAGDIKVPAGVKIVNPNLHLATLADENTRFSIELTAEQGTGYVMADERTADKVGLILVDALFSPILRVSYKVEPTRVGRRTDLDKLTLEIFTDGTITPDKAIKEAARILASYFKLFYEPRPKAKKTEKETKPAVPKTVARILIDELDLPTRVVNTLRKAKIETVGDLANTTRAELLKIKNLGGKSVKLVEDELLGLEVNLKGAE